MSIPIPLILALVAQKNYKSSPKKEIDESNTQALVPVSTSQRPQINRVQHRRKIWLQSLMALHS